MSSPEQLIQVYRWLRQYGNNDSHSGNASLSDGRRMWVTPTGACADTLNVTELLDFDLSDPPPPGASLDAPLHRLVYQLNSKARAVLHCHNPHAVALTLAGEDFSPPDFEGQLYFGRVRVLEVPYDEYVEKSPRMVAERLCEDRVTIVRGHGVYVWGETLDKAYKWACSLELSAKTAFIARQAGTWKAG